MHRSTLDSKLHLLQFVKLSAHNMALCHSMQRQHSQKELAHRFIGTCALWTSAS